MRASRARGEFLCAVFLYGTIGTILHWIVFPSELVVLCRGAVGALTILLYQLLRRKKADRAAIRQNLKWLVLSGVMLGLNWIFLFAAYLQTTVAVASLCNYMAPIVVIFLSPLLYQERLGPGKLLCVAAAFLGLLLVSGVFQSTGRPDPLGVVLGLCGAGGFVGVMLFNRKLRNIEALDRVTVQLAVSAVVVLPYVLFRNLGRPLPCDAQSVLLTLMLGVVHTGLAYCFYFGPMGILPMQSVALLGYLEPVVSVLCSALILREPLGLSGAGWAVLIIGAAAMGECLEMRKSAS